MAEHTSSGWDLVRAAQAGDQAAFAALYRQYQPQIQAFTRHRVGGDNRDLVADLTSETFTRAWRRLDTVTEQRADPGAWLMTIARNLITDHYKSAHTRLSRSVGGLGELEHAQDQNRASTLLASAEDAAIDGMDRAAAAHAVRGVLNRLPDGQQDTIRAILAEEPESAQAARTGLAITAVKTRRVRARHATRRLLHAAGITSSADIPVPRAARDRNQGRDHEHSRASHTVGAPTPTQHLAPTTAPEPTKKREFQMNEHVDRATKIVDRVSPNLALSPESRSAHIRVAAEALRNNHRVDEIELALSTDPFEQHKKAVAIAEQTIKNQHLDLTPEQRSVLVDEVKVGLVKRSIARHAASRDQARQLAERELMPAEKRQETEAHGLGVADIGA